MDSSNQARWSEPDTWVKGRRARVRPTRGRIIVLILLFVLAIFAARSCQQSQIRITKEQAIAIAERQIDFSPSSTQIRMLRQGLNRKPFWFVSMSDPVGSATNPQGFRRLVLVEIDANTGKVENVDNQIGGTPAQPKQSGQAAAGSKGGQH